MFVELAFWFLGQALFASAQTTTATCGAGHQWAFNSQKQSPCAVASSLLSVCTGTYTVNALPDPETFQYMGPDSPQDANPCWCNTVVYSLLSECGLCQGATISTWSIWEINCASVSIDSFPMPLPAGLHVPGWAYLDVKASDMFNESLAESSANTTRESTAVPQPSRTSSVSASTSSSAAAEPTTVASSSDASPPFNQQRSNAIGGGVVGGIFGLVLVLGLGFWAYRRRSIARSRGQFLNSPNMSEHRTDTLPIGSQPSEPVPSITVSTQNSQSTPASASLRSAQMV